MIKEKIIEIEIVKYIIAKKKLWERTKYQKQLNKNNNTVKNRNIFFIFSDYCIYYILNCSLSYDGIFLIVQEQLFFFSCLLSNPSTVYYQYIENCFIYPFNCARTAILISSNSFCSINPSANNIRAFLNLSKGASGAAATGAAIATTGVATGAGGDSDGDSDDITCS